MPLKDSTETKRWAVKKVEEELRDHPKDAFGVQGSRTDHRPSRELSGYYDSTEFCQFGSSIYDFAFMDVDKILPFSSTLGWHSLNVNGEVQKRKDLRWIPRYPETRKGVASDEMLRGVENKHRSGDSQIGQPFELPAESMSRQETTWRTETS
ncbi:hypothetical protein DAI22_01g066140 [Oryza sativa Japonica Group]|nr:hypothetical protein DAI22_01g066140 [Oryza sativa Japonica Group]